MSSQDPIVFLFKERCTTQRYKCLVILCNTYDDFCEEKTIKTEDVPAIQESLIRLSCYIRNTESEGYPEDEELYR